MRRKRVLSFFASVRKVLTSATDINERRPGGATMASAARQRGARDALLATACAQRALDSG